jgi:hypothetical protein
VIAANDKPKAADGLKGSDIGVFPVNQARDYRQDTALAGQSGRLPACRRGFAIVPLLGKSKLLLNISRENDGRM